MKIIHTSDWHIGKIVNEYSMIDDQKYILNKLIELIDEENADVLMIAGDVYDRSIPPVEAVELLNETLSSLVIDRNVYVLVISGNHDSGERLSFGSKILEKQGLYIAGSDEELYRKVVLCENNKNINFYLVPYKDPALTKKLLDNKEIRSHNDAMIAVIDKIKEELKENTVVFAGPSGVGKSSLLNEVDKNFELKTGEVSDKIKRGKHTTRHAELLKLECGGMVADTPGFSSLTLDDIDESELKEYFIEFDKYDDCRFGSRCIHENEPSCAVKEAVENGEISKKRYESYIQLLNEIRSGKRRY